jgi:hypothetical protein
MRLNAMSLIAVAASLTCGAASAQQSGFYGGATLSRLDVKPSGSPTYTPSSLNLVVGNQIDKYFAAEARLGLGLSGDSNSGTEVKVKDYVGGYMKVFAPLSYSASLYGMLGYTSGKVEVTTAGVTTRHNDNDVSYGVGGSFAINRLSFVTVELARLFGGNDYKVNALSGGIYMRF